MYHLLRDLTIFAFLRTGKIKVAKFGKNIEQTQASTTTIPWIRHAFYFYGTWRSTFKVFLGDTTPFNFRVLPFLRLETSET